MEPTTPPPFTKALTQQLRYHFTEAELLERGKKLSETHSVYAQIETDKKRSMTDFNAKIAAVKAEANSLADQVSTGYEIREIECSATMDTPTRGKKTITRNDTGHQEAIEVMTPSENSEADERRKQAEFDLANPVLNMDIVSSKTEEEQLKESNDRSRPGDPIEPGDEQPGAALPGSDEAGEGEDEEEPHPEAPKKKGKK